MAKGSINDAGVVVPARQRPRQALRSYGEKGTVANYATIRHQVESHVPRLQRRRERERTRFERIVAVYAQCISTPSLTLRRRRRER